MTPSVTISSGRRDASADTALETPSSAPVSTRGQVISTLLRRELFAKNPLPPWALATLQSLREESDATFFWQGMISIAQNLRAQGQDASSLEILASVASSEAPAPLRVKAQREMSAFLGGNLGIRSEFLLSRFCQSATDWRVITPMIAAGLVGRVASQAAWGRLSTIAAESRAPWFARGLSARLGAASVGYFAEVPTFAILNRSLAPEPVSGKLSEDLARSALSLGALKFFGFLGKEAGHRLNPLVGSTSIQRALIPTSSLLGLMSAHRLETKFGLRPGHATGDLFLDSLAALLSLSVGAHLGHGMLGKNFSSFQAQMEIASRSLPKAPNSGQAFPTLAFAGFQGKLAVSPERPANRSWMMMSSQSDDGGSGKKIGDSLAPVEVSTIVVDPNIGEDPLVGRSIDGRYKIEAPLGVGGMGKVYLASHEILGKKIAVKLLREDIASDEEALARFLNEAQAASAIGNPHIVDISDFGKLEDGTNYYVMEYLDGVPLTQLIKEGGCLPIPNLLHVARQIAEGLAAAHREGIVHRDLKPDNIFLVKRGSERNFVKILDFGIAKMLNSKQRITREGLTVGTVQYMSPEQAMGSDIDARSDVYAFGILLYEMASGKLPFDGPNRFEVLRMQVVDDAPPLSESAGQKIPQELEALIAKSMQKAPDERYASMEAVLNDLDRLLAKWPRSVASRAEPTEIVLRRPQAVSRAPRRRWPLWAALGGLGGGAAIVTALSLRPASQPAAPNVAPVLPDAGAIPPIDAAATPADAPKVPLKKQVTIHVLPKDAVILHDGKSLGKNSVQLEIGEGESLELEFRRRGYRNKKIQVDGLQEEISIRLERAAAPKKPIPPKENEEPKRPPPGEVISPWKE